MTHYDVKRLALVLAVQAEIEGMKAENMLREQNGDSPAYGMSQFRDMQCQLEHFAHAHDEEL